MSAVLIFKKETIPPKNLVKVVEYTYHPSSEMKAKILEDLVTNLKMDLDDYVVGIDVHVSLSEYTKKPEVRFWYDNKPTDDPEDTRI